MENFVQLCTRSTKVGWCGGTPHPYWLVTVRGQDNSLSPQWCMMVSLGVLGRTGRTSVPDGGGNMSNNGQCMLRIVDRPKRFSDKAATILLIRMRQ